MHHLSVPNNTELSEYVQDLCCAQLIFIYICIFKHGTFFRGGLPSHILDLTSLNLHINIAIGKQKILFIDR